MRNMKQAGAAMLKLVVVCATVTVAYFSPPVVNKGLEKMQQEKRISGEASALEENLPRNFAQSRYPIYLGKDVHYLSSTTMHLMTLEASLKLLPEIEAYSHKVYSVCQSTNFPNCAEDPVLARVIRDYSITDGYFVTEVVTPPEQRL